MNWDARCLDYLDGHLSDADAFAFEAELRTNPELKRTLTQLEQMRAMLRESAILTPVVGLEQVLKVLQHVELPWWRTPGWRTVLTISGSMIAVAIVLLLRPATARSEPRITLASNPILHAAKPTSTGQFDPTQAPEENGKFALASLRVRDTSSTLLHAEKIARETHGQLASIIASNDCTTIEIRVPIQAFDKAWEGVLAIGESEARTVFERRSLVEPGHVPVTHAVIRVQLLPKR